MNENESLYKVTFAQRDKIYEIYARYISEESLMGFIELEDLVFKENTGLIVDPNIEKLQNEFKGVKRVYIPLHEVLRIDEVLRVGSAKLLDVKEKKSNITRFPYVADPVDGSPLSGNEK